MFIRNFNFIVKNQVKMFVFISWKKQVKMLVFISWVFPLEFVFRYSILNISVMWWEIKLQRIKFLLELIKRRSTVQEKNMLCECGLNFNQWKKFSENCKPMRVWLWLVYKFNKNYCRLRLFSEFIQTQVRYPTSLNKIRILTWKLLAISS